jgi:hypothetical protein
VATHDVARPLVSIDWASASLLLVGVVFGAISIGLVATSGMTPLVLIPSVIAMVIGIKNFTKTTAPRIKDISHD